MVARVQDQAAQSSQPEQAAHYVSLAEQARGELKGPQRALWLDRLERELDGLRQALGWLVARGDTAAVEQALRLAGSLREFWWERGRLAEGRAWMDRLLALPAAAAPTTARAIGLDDLATIAYYQADYDTARARLEESLAIWRQFGGEQYAVYTLIHLGQVLRSGGGDRAAARQAYEEALALSRAAGFRRGVAYALSNLGRLAFDDGDHATARARLHESTAILTELRDVWAISFALEDLAALAAEQAPARALRLASASAALQETLGVTSVAGARLEARLALARQALSEADVAAASAEGRAMAWEEAAGYALGHHLA